MRHHPAVRVASYDDTHGPVQPDSFLDLARTAREQRTPLPPLLLDAVRSYVFRYEATEEQRRSRDQFFERLQRNREAIRLVQEAAGVEENRVVGEYGPDSVVQDTSDSFTGRLLFAFWRLCAQSIAVVTDAETNHAARLQADRSGMPADVRIVRLRRTTRKSSQEPGTRDWQHRWVVRMHKVRQWYPTLPGRLITQRRLLAEVWGPKHLSETNYLRVYLASLRRKLEDDPSRPRHLITEPGMGYRFEP